MADLDITDSESLSAWLDTRSQADCIAIAQRAALRVLPLCFSELQTTTRSIVPNYTVLFRALLTSGCMSMTPLPEIQIAANIAAGFKANANPALYAVFAAVAFGSVAYSTASSATLDAVEAMFAAVKPTVATNLWIEIEWDIGELTRGADRNFHTLWLWDPPESIAKRELPMLEEIARETGSRNSFWHRWWFATKRGTPMNWDMQRDIALIDDAVWDEGPKAVMAAIAEIELSYAIAATPNAEKISLNPTTQLFRSDPVSHLSNNHLADVVDTLQDATRVFDDAGGSNGPYGDLNAEVNLINDACERYQLRPLMLLRVCRRVVERVQIKEATGSCPKNDPLVADFLSLVGAAAADLYAFDSDVQEAERSRLASKVGPAFGDASAAIVEAADQSATISEGVLKDELPEDARTAASTEPSAARDIAAYQTRSRLLRIYAGVKKGVDHVERYPVVYGTLAAILLALLI
jgi:hypothetical protein